MLGEEKERKRSRGELSSAGINPRASGRTRGRNSLLDRPPLKYSTPPYSSCFLSFFLSVLFYPPLSTPTLLLTPRPRATQLHPPLAWPPRIPRRKVPKHSGQIITATHMDFLKSAVASAIAKGSSLPFSLGDRVDIGDSIWTLHNGTKRVGWLPTLRYALRPRANAWHGLY